MNRNQKGIIAWFTANPVAANLLMLLVIVVGVIQSGELRKEAFPSLEPDSLTISVNYDSGSAQQSEEGIAIKIEEQLEGVSGIDTITSSATRSGATVTIEKLSDYDLDTLLQDVTTKIDAISTFPEAADKPVIEKGEREEHSIWLQLYGEADRDTLQHLADNLKGDLLAEDDISRVSLTGWLDPMMTIEIDEGRLQSYGLTLSDVETAINNGSGSTMTAVLRNSDLLLQLQASEQAYRKQQFAEIPLLTAANGTQILLGDVTTISDTFDDSSSSLSRFNGHNSIAVQVVTTGLDDISNSAVTAKAVAERWITEGKLPEGIYLEAWYDRSTNINERLQLLVENALSGILWVFLLLALFLNLSVAIWVAAGLPFIFFGTLFLMGDNFLGLSLNEFTTFGFILALGIVVDDAVVVGESIYSVRKQEGDTLKSTISGTMRVAVPTLFGVFTTVAAFWALSNTEGRLGQLYSQFAAIVAICLLLSVIESKLILPAHLSHLNSHRGNSKNWLLGSWQKVQQKADNLFTFFNDKIYSKVITFALEFRYAVTLFFIAVFILVISMVFNGSVRMSFFPDIPGDTIRASVVMVNDASFGQTHNALLELEIKANQVDQQLSGDDNSYIAHLQVVSASDQSGEITVELAKGSPYDINRFTKQWRESAGLPEGVKSLNIQSSRRQIDAVRIELRASDDQILELGGNAVKEALNAIPAVFGVDDNLEPGVPQLHMELTQLGRSLGMNTTDLASQVLQAFSGQIVQRYQRDSDEIEVKVRYPERSRQDVTDVLYAKVRTPNGDIVPLTSVATISSGFTRDSITRIDGKRAVYITADVDKDQLSSSELVTQLKQTMAPTLERQFPGLDIHFAGEAEQQAETQSSMTQMFLIALLIIYLLLAIPLKSYIQPVLIMTAIPFGIIGAILGHWMNDLSLGILSLNGIVALSGVVVNDSLLLVSRFNDHRQTHTQITEAITRACHERLRPILLTSFTTYAGLMPLLSETSRQAQFLIPAAVSVAYGILFATLITLILIPALLFIQHDISEFIKRITMKLTLSSTSNTHA